MKKTKDIVIKTFIILFVLASIGVFASIVNDFTKTPEAVCVHEFSEWVEMSATCTTDGNMTRSCKLCGEEQIKRIEPLGHDYIYHDEKSATCDESGWNAYDTCSRCDYTSFMEIPAYHTSIESRIETVQEMSCTEDGITIHIVQCLDCYEMVSEETHVDKAYGHYFEMTIVNEPTCVDIGEGEYLCMYCGYKFYPSLPATGHTFNANETSCEVCHINVSEALSYELSDDGTYYIVTGIGTYTGDIVVIPPSINGVPVKKIGDEAFKNNEKITRVDLPNTIETVGISAFENCILAKITLPEGLKYIQKRAFYNCPVSYDVVVIPSTVIYISYYSFGATNDLIFSCCTIQFMGTPETINEEAIAIDGVYTIYVPWLEDYLVPVDSNAPWGAIGAEVIYGWPLYI